MLYNYLFGSFCRVWAVDDITYVYHIVDYSLGFCTKLLPGAIFGFFFKEPTPLKASIYETVLLIALFICTAFFLDRFINGVPLRFRKPAFILCALFITGPCSFAIFSLELGMLDVYWLYLSVIFIFLLQNRYLRLLLPFLFFLAILIHFSSLICYILFFALLILYELSCAKKKIDRRILLAVFCASVIVTAGTALYFFINEEKNLKYETVEELNVFLESRGAKSLIYYDYAFYHYMTNYRDGNILGVQLLTDSALPGFIVSAVNTVYAQIVFTLYIYFNIGYHLPIIGATVLAVQIPVLIWIYVTVLRFMKRQCGNNKLKRFVFLCMLLYFPVTILFGSLFSPDIVRWSTHAVLPLIAIYLYILYREPDKLFLLQHLSDMVSVYTPLQLFVYFVVRGALVVFPYW